MTDFRAKADRRDPEPNPIESRSPVMRLGIKGKQVLGVTSLVGAVVVILSVLHLSRTRESQPRRKPGARGAAGQAVFQRAREVVAAGGDPYPALRADPGCASILESSLYSKNVTFAALVDVEQRRRRARRPVARGAGAAAGRQTCGR